MFLLFLFPPLSAPLGKFKEKVNEGKFVKVRTHWRNSNFPDLTLPAHSLCTNFKKIENKLIFNLSD